MPQTRRLWRSFNLNTTYSDKAYVRQPLSFETYTRCRGSPFCSIYPLHVQLNSEFYSVAIFVEEPDEEYLKRQELDNEGALYKMYNKADSATEGVEKKTRLYEDHQDLQEFVDGIHQTGSALTIYLFDHVDLPSTIDYLVAAAIIQDRDARWKNYYLYRDSNHTHEWLVLPWDKDLTFGRYANAQGVLNDQIWAQADPFVLHGNDLAETLLDDPAIRSMYLRRLRTVMDHFSSRRRHRSATGTTNNVWTS